MGKSDASPVYYNWAINLVASSTLTAVFMTLLTNQLFLQRFKGKAFWEVCKFLLYVYKRCTHSVNFFIIYNVYLLKVSGNRFCFIFNLKAFFGGLCGIHSWNSPLLVCSCLLSGLQYPRAASQIPGDAICTCNIQLLT